MAINLEVIASILLLLLIFTGLGVVYWYVKANEKKPPTIAFSDFDRKQIDKVIDAIQTMSPEMRLNLLRVIFGSSYTANVKVSSTGVQILGAGLQTFQEDETDESLADARYD